jgi:gamma-glutamylputrescine oxidase
MQIDYTSQSVSHVDEPASYWQETATHPTLADDLPPMVEVAIIGGGILGTAISYWLARAGIAPLVLERTRLASEASGRNGGFVSIGPAESYPSAIARLGHETAHAVLALTRENHSLLGRILEEENIACEYREAGSLSLAFEANHLQALTQEVTALRIDGVAARMLDRIQVQEFVRTSLGPEIIGGRFMPEERVIHPIQLVHGLAHAAQRNGARFCAAKVLRLTQQGERMIVHTTSGSLQARLVIVAVNAWIGELLPALAPVITPIRGQVLAFAPIPSIFTTGMSTETTPIGAYWHQRGDGTIVLGGCRAAAPNGDIGVRMNQPTAEVQMALDQVFPQLFPELRDLQVTHRWAGIMAFTPDHLPIVDRTPDMPAVLVVGGFSGHGMPFALRLGELLAEALTSEQWPPALLLFRLNRNTLMKP